MREKKLCPFSPRLQMLLSQVYIIRARLSRINDLRQSWNCALRRESSGLLDPIRHVFSRFERKRSVRDCMADGIVLEFSGRVPAPYRRLLVLTCPIPGPKPGISPPDFRVSCCRRQGKTAELTPNEGSCQAHFAVLFKIASFSSTDVFFKMANLKKRESFLLMRVDM